MRNGDSKMERKMFRRKKDVKKRRKRRGGGGKEKRRRVWRQRGSRGRKTGLGA